MLPHTHHGTWTGTSRLWLEPDAAPETSDVTAEVTADALSYTWSRGDRAQQGAYTFTRDGDAVLATFTDSFHTGSKPMACTGTTGAGPVSVTGSYAAPPGPDWSWHTEIDTSRPGVLVLRMTNVSPEGEPSLAVETVLHR